METELSDDNATQTQIARSKDQEQLPIIATSTATSVPEGQLHGNLTSLQLLSAWYQGLNMYSAMQVQDAKRQFRRTYAALNPLDRNEVNTKGLTERRLERGSESESYIAKSRSSNDPKETNFLIRESVAARDYLQGAGRSSGSFEFHLSMSKNESQTKAKPSKRIQTERSSSQKILEVLSTETKLTQDATERTFEDNVYVLQGSKEVTELERFRIMCSARLAFNIGMLYGASRQFYEAREWFKEAVAMDQTMTIAWHALSVAEFELGSLRNSLRALRSTLMTFGHQDLAPQIKHGKMLSSQWKDIEIASFDDVEPDSMLPNGPRFYRSARYKLSRLLVRHNFTIVSLNNWWRLMKVDGPNIVNRLSTGRQRCDYTAHRSGHFHREKDTDEKRLQGFLLAKQYIEEKEAAGEELFFQKPNAICGIPASTLLLPPAELLHMCGIAISINTGAGADSNDEHCDHHKNGQQMHNCRDQNSRDKTERWLAQVSCWEEELDTVDTDDLTSEHPSALPSPLAIVKRRPELENTALMDIQLSTRYLRERGISYEGEMEYLEELEKNTIPLVDDGIEETSYVERRLPLDENMGTFPEPDKCVRGDVFVMKSVTESVIGCRVEPSKSTEEMKEIKDAEILFPYQRRFVVAYAPDHHLDVSTRAFYFKIDLNDIEKEHPKPPPESDGDQ